MIKHETKFYGSRFQIFEYRSINDYLTDAETMKYANTEGHSTWNKSWSGSDSYDSALEMARFGWDEVAKEMTAQLKVALKNQQVDTQVKSILDVCGFQCNVPMYLAGAPNNMIRQQRVTHKSKVINLIKPMGATANVSRDQYVKAGVECMKIINALEKKGYAVNLYVASASRHGSSQGYSSFMVKIKNANERLNVSKLAFFLASPSVHRRFNFALMKKYGFSGVGGTQDPRVAREMMKTVEEAGVVKNAYVLDSSLGQGFTGKSAEDMVDSLVKHFE